MILVDSSAFIEYYRPKGRKTVKEAVSEAIRADLVSVNGIIQVEMLSFVRDKNQFEALYSDFSAFHWLDLDRSFFQQAAMLGAKLRQQGVTVPATDLIIATSALNANATLYHLDAHFEMIAQHSALQTKDFR